MPRHWISAGATKSTDPVAHRRARGGIAGIDLNLSVNKRQIRSRALDRRATGLNPYRLPTRIVGCINLDYLHATTLQLPCVPSRQ